MTLGLVVWRNVRRHPFRVALTLASAASAVLAFALLRTVIGAWSARYDIGSGLRLGTRHSVTVLQKLPRRYLDEVRAVPGVRAATSINWFGGSYPADPSASFASLAVDATSYLEVHDEVVLTDDERTRWLATRAGALIGEPLARRLGLEIGDRITLLGSYYPGEWPLEIAGFYRVRGEATLDRSLLLFHWRYLMDGAPPHYRDRIGWVTSRVDDVVHAAGVGQRIDAHFAEGEVRTRTGSDEVIGAASMGMVTAVLSVLELGSWIILVVIMLVVGNTVAMAVRERRGEHAMMRALGFSPNHLAALVLGEAAALGLCAGLIGVGCTQVLVELAVRRWLEENVGGVFGSVHLGLSTAVQVTMMTIVAALAAAMPPVLRIARTRVVDALRQVD